MITFHLMSDLHLEFLGGKSFKNLIDKGFYRNRTKANILVLAGDITPNIRQYRMFLDAVSKEYDEVVAVAGNHEFYGHCFYAQTLELEQLFNKLHNTHYLNNEFIEVLGVKIYGGTCWTNMSHNEDQVVACMNDFYMIRGMGDTSQVYSFGSNCGWSVHEWKTQHNIFKENMLNYVEDLDLVISHHVPDTELIVPKYRGNSINAGYASTDMEELLRIPKFWVHGHTHDYYDRVYKGTRFICNPTGYHGIEKDIYNEWLEVII